MLKVYLVKIGGKIANQAELTSRWFVLGRQILILEDATFADYAARMHEIIDALASLQGVSQLAVYAAVMGD